MTRAVAWDVGYDVMVYGGGRRNSGRKKSRFGFELELMRSMAFQTHHLVDTYGLWDGDKYKSA